VERAGGEGRIVATRSAFLQAQHPLAGAHPPVTGQSFRFPLIANTPTI